MPRELASRYGTLLFTLIQVAPIATIMFGQKPQTALKCDNMLFGRVHMVVFAVFVVFVP